MPSTIILCGGRGTRLKPLTKTIPKPLVPLQGRPCLWHIINSYVTQGHRELVVCVGYLGHQIVEFLSTTEFDADIVISDAGADASMLRRLHTAAEHISERAFVAYGDTIVDVRLEEMLAQHVQAGVPVTMTTASIHSPFGLVTVGDDSLVRTYVEKPLQTYFIGHMLVDRSLLEGLPDSLLEVPDGAGLVALFEQLTEQGQLGSFEYDGPQITFNTQADLDQAERDIERYFTYADHNTEDRE